MPNGHELMERGAVEAMQRTLDRDAAAIAACYALIGAILLFGGAGFMADRYLGTSPWCLLGGLIAGLSVGFFQLARVFRH